MVAQDMSITNSKNTDSFHILALSGGGFKGLFTAVILEKLEEDFGYPIAKKFDLIAGTSIGGIIALALAAEIPLKTIKEFFVGNKKKIFSCPYVFKGLSFKSKYNNNHLKECLIKLFGDKKVKDLKHRIIIPTINYVKGSPQLLKTRHHDNFRRDIHWSLVDVALATSAAPVYFPTFSSEHGNFIDGGIVANHPGFFAYIEALEFLNIKPESIFQLHIGTTDHNLMSSGKYNDRKNGLLRWRENLIDLIFSCQEKSTEQILKFMLKDRYFSINSSTDSTQDKTIGLDNITDEAQNLLIQKANEASKVFMGQGFYNIIRTHNAKEFNQIPL